MADISQIKIGSTNYQIKDSVAREAINQLNRPIKYIGMSKGIGADSSNIRPIQDETHIDPSDQGKLQPTYENSLVKDNTINKRLTTGDVVSYLPQGGQENPREYIFIQDSNTPGQGNFFELVSNLGALAYVDKGKGTINSTSLHLNTTDVNVLSGDKYVSSIECEKMSQEVVTVGTLDPEKVGDGTGGTLNELIGRISWRNNTIPVSANVTDECLNLNLAIMETDTIDITKKSLSTGEFYEEPSEDKQYATAIDVIKRINSENALLETVATGGTSTDGEGDEIVTGISSTVIVNPI